MNLNYSIIKSSLTFVLPIPGKIKGHFIGLASYENSTFKHMIGRTLTLIFILLSTLCGAQDSVLLKDIKAVVFLDSVVVRASQQGMDIDSVIHLLRQDLSFYTAFKNLRSAAYEGWNSVTYQGRKSQFKASYTNRVVAQIEGDCQNVKIVEETVEGDLYKSGKKPKYFSLEMMQAIFFPAGKICSTTNLQTTESEKIDTVGL